MGVPKGSNMRHECNFEGRASEEVYCKQTVQAPRLRLNAVDYEADVLKNPFYVSPPMGKINGKIRLGRKYLGKVFS